MIRHLSCLLMVIAVGVAATSLADDRERQRSAVVQIDGCSGVLVSPAGLVMTAKHCDLSEVERVVIGDHEILAVRVYESPDPEGPLVYDCVGSGYPWVPVAASVPGANEPVYAMGYAVAAGARRLQEADGTISRGDRFGFRGEFFSGNLTDIPASDGWSGGPLFNAKGEVIGLVSAGDQHGSIFISHAATRAAWLSAQSLHASRPQLLVVTDLYCGNCLRFLGDYARDAGFRHEIQEHYRVVVVDVHADPGVVGELGIEQLPLFVIDDAEAIVGYRGKSDLLQQLILYTSPPSERSDESLSNPNIKLH